MLLPDNKILLHTLNIPQLCQMAYMCLGHMGMAGLILWVNSNQAGLLSGSESGRHQCNSTQGCTPQLVLQGEAKSVYFVFNGVVFQTMFLSYISLVIL